MGKESLEPAKEHQRSLSGNQPSSSGTLSRQVIYGWDDYSLLILSIILTGTLPLAITSGIAIGAIFWSFMAPWGAILTGVVIGLAMIAVQYGLLRLVNGVVIESGEHQSSLLRIICRT